mmetsp:Transcript_20470/g.41710  ORF Transcript_20470/g.41710 Transcript_20470/m.41710 type:complete len:243 (-) Transcript_20470:1571-2299(-)
MLSMTLRLVKHRPVMLAHSSHFSFSLDSARRSSTPPPTSMLLPSLLVPVASAAGLVDRRFPSDSAAGPAPAPPAAGLVEKQSPSDPPVSLVQVSDAMSDGSCRARSVTAANLHDELLLLVDLDVMTVELLTCTGTQGLGQSRAQSSHQEMGRLVRSLACVFSCSRSLDLQISRRARALRAKTFWSRSCPLFTCHVFSLSRSFRCDGGKPINGLRTGSSLKHQRYKISVASRYASCMLTTTGS